MTVDGGIVDNSTDLTDVVVALDVLANAATLLALVAVVIAVVQYFGDGAKRREEYRRLEEARQEHVYEVVASEYDAFLRMCMENPDLTLSQLSLRQPRAPERAKPDPIRDLILFEYFFNLLERVYVLYRADEIYEIGPNGQLNSDVMNLSHAEKEQKRKRFQRDLRHRQWWGWDLWIRQYLDSHLAESWAHAWAAMGNTELYDSGFGAYMNYLISESAQRQADSGK